MSGTLYIVATPIGNLEDLSLRALSTLKEVGLIAAEDTRVTRKILNRFKFKTPIISFNEHNSAKHTPKIIKSLMDSDVALVCDAGTPLISDPGRILVDSARQNGYRVSPIPGPSSITASISVAATKSSGFCFVGFLPRGGTARTNLFRSIKGGKEALVFFESPHRLISTLKIITEISPTVRLTICRELTKLHEEIWQGSPEQACKHFEKPLGEFVVILEPDLANKEKDHPDSLDLKIQLTELKEAGLSRNAASALLAKQLKLPKREIYKNW